ncbi:MAG: 4'-phosphopantetheinyl transferase superfamily protein [Bdellovibrionota bacterium]
MIEEKLETAFDSLVPGVPKAIYWREYPAEFKAEEIRAFETARSAEAKSAISQRLRDLGIATPLVSFSHSSHDGKLGIIGVGVGSESEVAGIGVDLEAPGRQLSPELAQRLIHESEAKFDSISPLGFWVIKEAAFKSLPKNTGALVSQFVVEKFNQKSRIGEMITGRASFRFQLIETKNWLIALVVCINPGSTGSFVGPGGSVG